MGAVAGSRIVRTMSTSPLEHPAPVRPVLVTIASVTLGAYVLFGALALAERAHGRWGLGLVPVAVACFAVAAREVLGFLRPD